MHYSLEQDGRPIATGENSPTKHAAMCDGLEMQLDQMYSNYDRRRVQKALDDGGDLGEIEALFESICHDLAVVEHEEPADNFSGGGGGDN